jgi:hypothetical protein
LGSTTEVAGCCSDACQLPEFVTKKVTHIFCIEFILNCAVPADGQDTRHGLQAVVVLISVALNLLENVQLQTYSNHG